MIWKKPRYRSQRKRLRFALVPVHVEEYSVWLEFYYEVQEYIPHYSIPDAWEFKDRELLHRDRLKATLEALHAYK